MTGAPIRPLVVCCSWCLAAGVTSEVAKERVAKASGALVSHGLCAACKAKYFPKRAA